MKTQPDQKRMLISFIVPTILMLITIANMLVFQSYTVEQTRKQTYQSLADSAMEQTATLNEIIKGRFSVLEAFANALAEQQVTPTLEDLTARMRAIAEISDFENIAVAGLDGVAYTDDGITDDSSDRFYMTEALAGRRAIQKLTDSRLYQENRIVLAVPVYKDGSVVGTVMGSFSDENLQMLIVSSAFAGNAYSLVCDSTGYVIVHPEKTTPQSGSENVLELLAGEDARYYGDAALETIKDDLQNGRGGIASYSIGAEKRYTVYQPMDINDWFIFTVVPSEIVDSAIAEQSRLGFICIGSVAVCAVLMLVIMAWREHRRLRELKRLQEQQLVYYRTDPVTGLLNAPGFTHEVTETLSKLPEEQFCAMLDFGIINFNQYNVSFGSPAGDALLKGFSQTLVDHCRVKLPCAHLSGDRFACLVYDCANEEELLERIMILDKKLHMPKRTHQLLMTYGVFIVDDRTLSAEELCDRAVAARLELTGMENIIGIYNHTVHQKQIEDSILIESMEESLRSGEFVPYYQPKFDARTERIVGAEALVRWIRQDGVKMPPDRFIRLFEQNGLISKLDMYMFETVCKKLAAMEEPVPISLNFSRANLYDADFPDKLADIADLYGVPRRLLEAELTETAFFDQRDVLMQKMSRLRELGFLVSIDDFGSGYSSLNLLKDIPFDVVKLDKEFFSDTTGSNRGKAVVKSVLELAETLGVHTVAEGVETKEQLKFLRENGCDTIQGYYFSRPVPEARFDELIDAQEGAVKEGAQ